MFHKEEEKKCTSEKYNTHTHTHAHTYTDVCMCEKIDIQQRLDRFFVVYSSHLLFFLRFFFISILKRYSCFSFFLSFICWFYVFFYLILYTTCCFGLSFAGNYLKLCVCIFIFFFFKSITKSFFVLEEEPGNIKSRSELYCSSI